MGSLQKRLMTDFHALGATMRFVWLVAHADNLGKFFQAIRDGEWEEVYSQVGMTEEEFHDQVSIIREEAADADVDHSELEETSREEFVDP